MGLRKRDLSDGNARYASVSASACRMFAAIVVVIIYCLLSSNRDSILFFVVTFLIYYFVILIYDTWYFVKIEKKIKNNV